ncbi:MAG: putative Nitric oxide dioxygenase [Ignavibacteria bacterium]|nr:putative Nitric oxide dioxygenase [Ignavibacteria bacterium]
MPTPIKVPVRIEQVFNHNDTIKSFVMKPLKFMPDFHPGQFLHFAIDDYSASGHWPESRVFSIASSPTRKDSIRITFIVKGAFTERMFREVKEGDTAWVKFPYGNFTINQTSNLALIAGGTGITPFISFLEYAIDTEIESNITLYYGIKSKENFIYSEVLEECKKKLKNFTLILYIEDVDDKPVAIPFTQGRINLDKIYEAHKDDENCLYYISGPQVMVTNFMTGLIDRKIPQSRVIIDEWE